MNRRGVEIFLTGLFVIVLLSLACSRDATPTPTAAPTAIPSPVVAPQVAPTPTSTLAPAATPIPTATPVPTATPTPTDAPAPAPIRFPSVAITSPENLSLFGVGPIVVSGTVAEPTASVEVDGVPDSVRDGTFTAQIPLHEGNNSRPTSAEIKNCSGYFKSVLDLVRPKIVVTLGAVGLTAVNSLCGTRYQLGDSVARPITLDDFILLPLYHPSPRVTNWKRPLAQQKKDFQIILKLLASVN